jgi:hypothetical protein
MEKGKWLAVALLLFSCYDLTALSLLLTPYTLHILGCIQVKTVWEIPEFNYN